MKLLLKNTLMLFFNIFQANTSKMLIFFIDLLQTPYGQLNLSNSRIEEVDTSFDSDDEAELCQASQHVLAIWPTYQGPTYLVIPSIQEKVILCFCKNLSLPILFTVCMLYSM